MTRKIISLFLALILCSGFVLSVHAAGTDFVVDELGYLTEEERSSLNEQAAAVCEQTGVGIFYAYVYAESAEDYDVSPIVGGMTDYVVMVETEEFWFMQKSGRGEEISFDEEDVIRAVYDETPTYAEGVAAYLEATAEYFPALPAATEAAVWDEDAQFLFDEANLLTADQEAELAEKLESLSHTYSTHIAIATVPGSGGNDVGDYTRSLYASLNIGYGETKDGVLLLVCMDPREYRILSKGHTGVTLGVDQVDALCSFVDLYLPNGHYAAAFNSFADQCGEMLAYAQAGSPFLVGKNLAISLVIGVIAGLIVAFVLKAQLKSVRKQDTAHVYVKKGSMHVNLKRDIFLYRHVKRSRRQEREKTTSTSGSGDTAETMGGGSF